MAFNFRRLLDVIRVVSKTKTFDKASELAFKEIGKKIDQNAHNPETIKEIASELIHEAPAIVGAIAKGTEAEKLVDPKNVHGTAEAKAATD
jgi:hypothetical protein